MKINLEVEDIDLDKFWGHPAHQHDWEGIEEFFQAYASREVAAALEEAAKGCDPVVMSFTSFGWCVRLDYFDFCAVHLPLAEILEEALENVEDEDEAKSLRDMLRGALERLERQMG